MTGLIRCGFLLGWLEFVPRRDRTICRPRFWWIDYQRDLADGVHRGCHCTLRPTGNPRYFVAREHDPSSWGLQSREVRFRLLPACH